MPKKKRLNYFFLDGQLEKDGPIIPLLHKRLLINRGPDQITTWCYPLKKRVTYAYTDVKKNMGPAYTTKEAAKMLNRGYLALERGIQKGSIERPQITYGLDERMNPFKYMWSERDIMNAHSYFLTVHFGRPRKDGMIIPTRLPNARQVRAMIRQEEILYVKTDDGSFAPVWSAENYD